MQPVGVLVRVDALQRSVLIELLGQRQLHDVTGALGVGVQFVDGLVEGRLADVGRQVAPDRGDAHLRAVGMLTADVSLRPRIVADQDGAQPGCAARCGQCRDPLLQIDEDLVPGGLAVQRDCAHAHSLACPGFRLLTCPLTSPVPPTCSARPSLAR